MHLAPRPQPERELGPTSPGAASNAPFHGWKILAVGVAAQMLGIGLIHTYPFLVSPLIDEFGISKAQVGLGMPLMALTGALMGPFLGSWLGGDGNRVRRAMLWGVAAMLLGMFGLAGARSALALMAAAVLVFAGVLLYGPLPVHVLMVNWFSQHRARAIALSALGISLPGFFMPGLSVWLIDAYGWRVAYRVLGIGCAVLLLPPLWAWVVTRPELIGQAPDGAAALRAEPASGASPAAPGFRELVRNRDFWIIAFGVGLMLAAPAVNGVYLVRHMEELGISRVATAAVVSWIAGIAIVGKLLTAWLADRIDKRRLAWALGALQIGAWLMILDARGYATLMVAGVGFGLGVGGFVPMPSVFVGAWFGRAAFARVAGLMSFFRLPITLSMVPLGGWVADRSGGHAATFLVAIAAVSIGGLILLLLRVPEKRARVP